MSPGYKPSISGSRSTEQRSYSLWQCHICNDSSPLKWDLQQVCVMCAHQMCNICKKDDDIPSPLHASVAPRHTRTSPTMQASSVLQQDQLSPFRREGKLLDLPMFFGQDVKGKLRVNVIPDTGATINVISQEYLDEINKTNATNPTSFMILDSRPLNVANGNTISTIGQTTIPCSFLDDPENIMQVVFHVCSTLASSVRVVVGRRFLDITKTLTIFAHRMVERRPTFYQVPRVMCLSTQQTPSKLQLSISINSKQCLACPDTGSEIDLFSVAFAEEMKFRVQRLTAKDPSEIEYADGNREQLLGKVVAYVSILKGTSRGNSKQLGLANGANSDSEGEDRRSKKDHMRARNTGVEIRLTRQRTFYVVGALASNAILGQAFLYSTDAYNAYKHSFVESNEYNTSDTLNGIFVRKCTSKDAPKTPTTSAELNAALNKFDQQYISKRRTLDREMANARDSCAERKLEAAKQALKQEHELASQRTRKEYNDALAKT